MKSVFSIIEIAEFLQKQKRQIEADYLIMEATKPKSGEIVDMVECMSAIHEIGFKQGSLDGRMEVINSFLEFFEL
jgi:uncharacterized protein (DUF302 family)